MRRLPLGRTGIEVSQWCLGTMTFGNQTPEADAHAQIEQAHAAGINFMDCAEMYPVNPVRAETVGLSETILGNWFARTGRRDDWIVATKVTGSSNKSVRSGEGYDGSILRKTVEASLRRLQTDRIDLYQTHWPERGSYHFRQNWKFDPSGQVRSEILDHMTGVLETMDALIKEGKVRAFGLSNDSCWGTMEYLRLAREQGLPRVASVQNEYSLLCRLFDTDMAEMSVNEDVLLLAYSPLGAGLLTGKYQGGAVPEGSRMARNGNLGGRRSERVFPAVAAYLDVAARHGLDPVQMALAWQKTRPFPVCTILGATTTGQLERILAGREVEIGPEVIADIDAAHKAHPLPY